ncbi:MAG TPA: autotransporter-associated beta strand repeat-containing protein, partial [Pirellulales bacterium]
VADKSSGAAIAGSVLVGNNSGGSDADVLQYGPGASSAQVSGTITVESTGLLDLATNADSAGNAIVSVVGPSSSANIITGGGALTGTSFTTIGLAGATAASPAATISGNISTAATTTFAVERSGATDDLNVSALISGTGLVVKSGWGTLDLSNDNSYSGDTYINANGGTVVVLADGALGSYTGYTTVNTDSTLAFRGGIDYSTAQSIYIAGSGLGGISGARHNGAIDSLSGANTFAGLIYLLAASSIGVTSGSLAETGGIFNASPLTLNGFGTLIEIGGIQASSVTVNNITLSGTGAISGPVTLATAGELAPGIGSTPASISTGSLTLDPAGAYSITLNGSTAGSGYSQDDVEGIISLGGATLFGSLGFIPAGGTSFTIIDNDSSSPVTGTFNNLPQGSIASIGGIGFTVNYNSGPGDDVVLVANNAPSLSGSASLASIIKNPTSNPGTSIPALIASGLTITDADSGAIQGIAVDSVNDSNGTWQFSTNSGTTWTAFNSP